MLIYPYALEGLDLALVLRARISRSNTPTEREIAVVGRLAALVRENSERRARDRKTRTGHSVREEEDELQALIVATLRADPLEYRPGRSGIVAVHGSPLGRWRTKMDRALASRAGAGAGWPDLDIRLVDVANRPRSLLVELKTTRGRVSREQKELHKRLVSAGFECLVVHGLSGFVETLCGVLCGQPVEVPF